MEESGSGEAVGEDGRAISDELLHCESEVRYHLLLTLTWVLIPEYVKKCE